MRARCATAAFRVRIRPIAEDPPEQSRYRQVHIAIYGVAIFTFVAYLMDFIGQTPARFVMFGLAVLATALFSALVLRRLAGRGQEKESTRAFLYLAGVFVFGLLFMVSRMAAGWPFGAELTVLGLVWSVTASGSLMALLEPHMINRLIGDNASWLK